jgi:hypothetical protein
VRHRVVLGGLPTSDSTKGIHARTHDHSALIAPLKGALSPASVFAELILACLQALTDAEASAALDAGLMTAPVNR